VIAATVFADLVFIFGSTISISSPFYYDRILIFAFFVLHLTETYYGRAHASLALGAVVVGYTAVVTDAIRRGVPLLWPEELLSIAVFSIAGVLFVVQYGGFRRRLTEIVTLFERAEEGDFARAYDVEADTRPDAITLVGRAYNRVRSQLASMVLTDPLTGCLNRRGFEQALTREVARSMRAGSQFALLALDLDHFKDVNDSHGHMVGDAVLREAALLLMRSARGGDITARTGGEEFSVILPDTDARGAFQLAARLCETMREHPFEVGHARLRLTVSIGVMASDGELGPDVAEELKRRADDALYSAKRSGRDRVRSWEPEMSLRRTHELRDGLAS
jgi:diguanylate cyclase (GGDEF)-like protein